MNTLAFLPRVCFVLLAALFACAAPARAQMPVQSLSQDRVTFFTEPNFKGDSIVIEAGASVENLDTIQRNNGRPWSFAISSIRVEGAATAVVFGSAGFRGERLEVTRSVVDLYGERRGNARWDRAIASIAVTAPPTRIIVQAPEPPRTVVVIPAPQPVPPPVVVEPVRPRFSYREAEAIVQRAYREVLDRSADPVGMRRYRDRLMHEGWSDHQVIHALQRSDEARAINADVAITKIYHDVLGRDPDPHGLAHYRGKWRDGWTQGAIRDDLRRSREGRDSQIRLSITRSYRELLGRDPDPEGYANFERQMREKGLTERDLRQAILSSDEYRQRQNSGEGQAPGQGKGPGRGKGR